MNTPVLTGRLGETFQRRNARIAGVFYLPAGVLLAIEGLGYLTNSAMEGDARVTKGGKNVVLAPISFSY